ncbi:hypothetical protein T03_8908 [Trichinella britovi]|uniref:Uncharacterized protein n=1 Tax=Trichinella britovi TaxID=45882 RepID=A0A0V1AMJ7_TRIBR|nr:hypothetical protein T03_8908 [Trichinella britovi]
MKVFNLSNLCDDDHEIAPAHHVYLFVGRPAVKTKLSAWSSKSFV